MTPELDVHLLNRRPREERSKLIDGKCHSPPVLCQTDYTSISAAKTKRLLVPVGVPPSKYFGDCRG